jgi:hypothetical protein
MAFENIDELPDGFDTPPEGLPGEPFELVSDVSIDASVASNHPPSYSIEYSANNGRGGIRHLIADTFKINDTRNYNPSPSSNDPYLPNDYYCGRSVGTDEDEFISIDIQPYIASDVSENGSTIKNYTTFWSRPEMWRVTDGGPELYEVTNIENVKHFRTLPFDEVRMYEEVWPGTQVGIATGIIRADDKRTIYNVTVPDDISFSSQPSGCAGIDWSGFTQVYKGDLIHDSSTSPQSSTIIPRNTRINLISANSIQLNKNHTYTGVGSTTIQFTIRRIGPSAINREYGYYFRHYDWEDPIHAYNGIVRDPCSPGGAGYWQGENQHATGDERYALDHQFLSEYSYGFYYGKIPDGYYKKNEDDPKLDLNGNIRYQYNSDGRWGIYIDDEVKNYFEGRLLIGHNIGIGTGVGLGTDNTKPRHNLPVNPDPIVSIFNNKWKNQQDEINPGSGGNCIGTRVTDPEDPMQYQIGLYVEDMVGIGTRVDLRYQLNVDSSNNDDVEKALRVVGDTLIVGSLEVSAGTINANISGSAASANTANTADTATFATNAGGLTGTPNITVGTVTATDVNSTNLSVSGTKSFDIEHPSKDGWRLKYVCLEGPSADVYIRGKIKNSNIIELPDYWAELVDQETIMVNLTPFGVYQELFVEKIEWGKKITIKNNLGGPINCSYVVYAERKDILKNVPEYQPNA